MVVTVDSVAVSGAEAGVGSGVALVTACVSVDLASSVGSGDAWAAASGVTSAADAGVADAVALAAPDAAAVEVRLVAVSFAAVALALVASAAVTFAAATFARVAFAAVAFAAVAFMPVTPVSACIALVTAPDTSRFISSSGSAMTSSMTPDDGFLDRRRRKRVCSTPLRSRRAVWWLMTRPSSRNSSSCSWMFFSEIDWSERSSAAVVLARYCSESALKLFSAPQKKWLSELSSSSYSSARFTLTPRLCTLARSPVPDMALRSPFMSSRNRSPRRSIGITQSSNSSTVALKRASVMALAYALDPSVPSSWMRFTPVSTMSASASAVPLNSCPRRSRTLP